MDYIITESSHMGSISTNKILYFTSIIISAYMKHFEDLEDSQFSGEVSPAFEPSLLLFEDNINMEVDLYSSLINPNNFLLELQQQSAIEPPRINHPEHQVEEESDSFKLQGVKEHDSTDLCSQGKITTMLEVQQMMEDTSSKLKESAKGCSCKLSKCLKNYCECFKLGNTCLPTCTCVSCLNTSGSTKQPIIVNNKQQVPRSKGNSKPNIDGCRCKNSRCIKNYCQCYSNGIGCSEKCKCSACKNKQHRPEFGRHGRKMVKIVQFIEGYDRSNSGQSLSDHSSFLSSYAIQ